MDLVVHGFIKDAAENNLGLLFTKELFPRDEWRGNFIFGEESTASREFNIFFKKRLWNSPLFLKKSRFFVQFLVLSRVKIYWVKIVQMLSLSRTKTEVNWIETEQNLDTNVIKKTEEFELRKNSESDQK